MLKGRRRKVTADREDFWQAVMARDARFHSAFVYAVRSTGVYCRPTCPSRRPRREQVRFFLLPEQAEQAGFRPCRRCRPRLPAGDQLRKICRLIESNLDGPLTLETLGRQVGMSPHHLQRAFKQALNVSPRQYAGALRIAALKSALKEGHNVTTAMYGAGYGSSRGLYEQAQRRLGMTPGVYRRGGEGMEIAYTLLDCPLGRLLVAATLRGVCAVYLGDRDEPLIAALAEEYPRAAIRADEKGLGRWAAKILKHLKGKQPRLDLPLDLQATAFQQRVWQELQSIPYGETRTYRDVAERLGRPTATRAVARACATNPVSIVIPCHRVVREDGSLAGYRWGVERKQALLARERGEIRDR